MRIRTQLIAALSFSALLCATMVVSVGIRVRTQSELMNAYDRAQSTAQACANLLALTQEFAFYGEPRAAQQWRKRYADIKRNSAEEVAYPQFQVHNLASLNANIEHLSELFIALEDMSREPVDALTPMRKQLIVNQLVTNTTNVSEDAYQLANEINDERKLSSDYFLVFYIAITIFLVSIIAYFAYVIFYRILRPLTRLEYAAAAVRSGNLAVRNSSLVQDELGDLGREFDEMTNSLEKRSVSLVMVNADLAQQVALRTKTEQRIRLITDNLPALIAYITTDGIYAFVNRQFDIVLGLDSTSMVGMHVRDVLGEKNFERLRPRAGEVFYGKPVSFEVRLETAKASRDFLANYIPDFDEQGQIVGFFVMHEDITERKVVDAQLRALNDRFLLATEAGSIGVWEWHIAENRLSADARMHALYQLEPGAGSADLGSWMERVDAADRDRVYREFNASVEQGVPFDSEFRLRLPDHSVKIIKANGLLSGSAEAGRLSLIGVNWDMSALRDAERAQRESEARLRLFVDGVQGYSIIMLDAKGMVISWNQAAQRMNGYRAEEIIGQHCSIFLTPESMAAGHAAHMLKTAEHTGQFHEEGLRRHKDGSQFFAEVTITALRDEVGALRGFSIIKRDLTERRQKEAVIVEALAEKETLLKEVYHRVKNNLQIITSLLKLQARALGPGPAHDALSESVGRVRAMAMVHEKLYQSGSLSSIQIREYIVDLSRDLALSTGASERGVVITCDIAPIQMRLETAVPLGLLLNELVLNCLKHAFPQEGSGAVRISLLVENGTHAVVCVADNGVGLAAGFDMHSSRSLGLKLATTLATQLDGDLEIMTDHGLMVRLRFPLPRAQNHTHEDGDDNSQRSTKESADQLRAAETLMSASTTPEPVLK